MQHYPRKDKNERMYKEVRYARDTATMIPKNNDIFRLKRQYQNLTTKEYAVNLTVYLEKVAANTTASIDDFVNAVDILLS